MRLEHESVEKLKIEVLRIIKQYLNIDDYRVFFFGSRVAGVENELSDIDIGIEGRESIPSGVLSGIENELDNLPILYKIDIVDFKKVLPDFYKVAIQRIEPIN